LQVKTTAAKLLLEREQLGLGVHLEGARIKGVPLVAAAVAVMPPQRAERVELRADHEPPRTTRTWRLLFLLFAFTLPDHNPRKAGGGKLIELIEGQPVARGERIDFVSIEVFVGWTTGRGDGRWPGGLARCSRIR